MWGLSRVPATPHERLLNRKINSFPIVHKYQLGKKARGNPLRILNLPFQHSHNSLRIYCAS